MYNAVRAGNQKYKQQKNSRLANPCLQIGSRKTLQPPNDKN